MSLVSLAWCSTFTAPVHAATATPCPADSPALHALAPGVWWFAAAPGDTTADNRGLISNLLAVKDGHRLWLLGSGPTRTQAHRLACQLSAVGAGTVTDVIAPWPRPELVLGQAAWPRARRWAHAEVAVTMQERCPHCAERLRQRLGYASTELGENPILLPNHLLQGDQGRLGPWRWWRLRRSDSTPVTVWALPRHGLIGAHGLLWADGPPDLRDADSTALAHSWRTLITLPVQLETARRASSGREAPIISMNWRWLPEQGPLQERQAPLEHLQYLRALEAAITAAQTRGAQETDTDGSDWGLPAQFTRGLRHNLNWQKTWREIEDREFAPPTAKP